MPQCIVTYSESWFFVRCYECDDQIVPAQGRNPIVQECQSVVAKILQSRLAKARGEIFVLWVADDAFAPHTHTMEGGTE